MGDVVDLTEARRMRPHRRSEIEISEPGTIALFTGVRIEHWDERDPRSGGSPHTRPTPPRRRRRRT
jgi:hypothetical protein